MKAYRKHFIPYLILNKRLTISSRGQYGQDYFTLRSVYLEGRTPKSVNMYWRRFAMSSIPLDDPEKFDLWLRERWTEKDALIEQYVATGRFPESKDFAIPGADSERTEPKSQGGFLESNVNTAHFWEFLQIFMVLGAFSLVANILAKVWNVVLYGKPTG
jgi:lysocardiolipin and lysophospholipid acyltransferase